MRVFSVLILLFTFGLSQDSDGFSGCTDSEACNYDADVSEDDGSCLYYDCNDECGGNSYNCALDGVWIIGSFTYIIKYYAKNQKKKYYSL